MTTNVTAHRPARPRNPRGQGARLRRELVDAAVRLLDAGVRDDELSLRAVAKEAGVAAPSIYSHFDDREDMLTGVVEALFAELSQRLLEAQELLHEPADRLRSMCLAYCTYAFDRPMHYRALFARCWQPSPDVAPEAFPGWDAFAVLQDAVQECIDARRRKGVDAFESSVRIWAALHGMASLRVTMPRFPWPALEDLVGALVNDCVGRREPTRKR